MQIRLGETQGDALTQFLVSRCQQGTVQFVVLRIRRIGIQPAARSLALQASSWR